MALQIKTSRLRSSVSALAISTVTIIGSAALQPAAAADGIFAGGSSLVSLAMRQIMDCYQGVALFNDGYMFDPSFSASPPTPGLLPTACTVSPAAVEGIYAAVGSGNGFRGFIANDSKQFNVTSTAVSTQQTPATLPVFVDMDPGAAAGFDRYPYPNVDFGASDSPLPVVATPTLLSTAVFSFAPTTDWFVDSVTTTISITSTANGNVNYNSSFGDPLQLPLIEAPAALAINTSGMTVNSAMSDPSQPGGAIQLTSAQICAIFSGTVTDWNSNATVAALNAAGALTTQAFSAANIGGGTGTATAYSTSSLPIRVVYRNDGSGTSFILTNYLKSTCTQLDDGSNQYAFIFGNGLPSTSFAQLKANIDAKFSSPLHTTNFVAANLSQGVAQAIDNPGNNPGLGGSIGYLSADFTQPYVSPFFAAFAPLSASVQNEDQRANGIDLPSSSSGGANPPTFIPPTPAAVDLAFGNLAAPSGTTYSNWNLYAQVWPTSTPSGGIDLAGKSILGIPTASGAYPIAGTTFGAFYSCYRPDGGTTARADRIKDFLTWYYANSSLSASILQNNGFHELPATMRTNASSVVNTITAGPTCG